MAARAAPSLILDGERTRMLIDAAHMPGTSSTERADHNESRDSIEIG
jgi:hypothetical protein